VIARKLLARAGYREEDLADAAPLLRTADEHAALERQMTGKTQPGEGTPR
jgi:hypothetical protein